MNAPSSVVVALGAGVVIGDLAHWLLTALLIHIVGTG